MTNLDSILKSKDITLPIKVHLVKAMVFPVVMYRCECWTIKKAEHQRIDGFELWCWRRLLRVPWTARRSKRSILKEISPEYSLEGLMLKLKLQYLATRCEELTYLKDLDAGKDWRRDEKGTTDDEMVGWHHRLEWVWVNFGSWWWTGRPGVLQSMGLQIVRHNRVTEMNWTELNWMDLTFQAPMQYCSLQHWTLLPSPVTSTMGVVFSLALSLHSSWSYFSTDLVAYWAPTNLGSSSFSDPSFWPFHTVHEVLKARILKWFAIPFSTGPRFVRTLHHDSSVLGGPTWHGSLFQWVRWGCHPCDQIR